MLLLQCPPVPLLPHLCPTESKRVPTVVAAPSKHAAALANNARVLTVVAAPLAEGKMLAAAREHATALQTMRGNLQWGQHH